MTRQSSNEVIGGRLINGYDYTNQAWVRNGRYDTCGHVDRCTCFGKKKAGVQTSPKGADYFLGIQAEGSYTGGGR